MRRRVVVPDTSVVVAAFYAETYTRQATRLIDAIDRQGVVAFAPHALIQEFLGTSAAKLSRRQGAQRLDPEIVDEQVERFFETARGFNFIRETDLQAEAWRLMREAAISPPDSWMLACAIAVPDSELWISHDHEDGFVQTAKRHHPLVFTLASDAAMLP